MGSTPTSPANVDLYLNICDNDYSEKIGEMNMSQPAQWYDELEEMYFEFLEEGLTEEQAAKAVQDLVESTEV